MTSQAIAPAATAYRFKGNAVALVCAKAAFAILSFLQFAALVHCLDRDSVNAFATAIAVQNLLAIGADFGVSFVAAKHSAARGSRRASSVLAAGLATLALFNAIAWAVTALVMSHLFEDRVAAQAVFLACILGTLRTVTELIDSIATSQGRSAWVAAHTTLQYGAALVGSWVLLALFHSTVIDVLLWTAATSVLSLGARSGTLGIDVRGLFDAAAFRQELAGFLHRSPAFGMHALIVALASANVYTIVISQFPAASLFQADFQGAQKIAGLAGLVGGVIARSFYVAACHATNTGDQRLLGAYVDDAVRMLAIVATAVTVPCMLLREQIVVFLYGNHLPEAADILLITAVGLPFSFLGFVPSNLLAASGRHWLRFAITAVYGLASWPVAWFCTQAWDVRGAAAALSAMTALAAIAFAIAGRCALGYSLPLVSVWRVALAAGMSAAIAVALRDRSHLLAALCAAEAAFVVVLVTIDPIYRQRLRAFGERFSGKRMVA